MSKSALIKYSLVICASFALWSCKKETVNESKVFVIKFWDINLTPANVIPANTGRSDHAYALLYLMDDNKLYYDIYVDSVQGKDVPTGAQISLGSPVVNGTQFVQLSQAFTDNKAKGFVSVTQPQIDSLLLSSSYLTISSSVVPTGLLRGQLDKNIVYAGDIPLSGNNMVPPVNATATGTTFLRLSDDNNLFYNIQISGVPLSDTLTDAHIHNSSDNSIAVKLASQPGDYNRSNILQVGASIAKSLQSSSLYIDVHSKKYANGLIRGTIR